MGGASSITDIGLMLIMNVLLVSNFFFVRHLRKIVDKNGVESNDIERDDDDRGSLIRLKQMQQSSKSLVKRLRSFYKSDTSDPAASSLIDQSRIQQDDESSRKWTIARIRDLAHVIALGKHRLEPCDERPFTNWEPIPLKMGIISTALALIFTTLLLSTELYHTHIPDAIRTSDSTSGFCNDKSKDEKFNTFKEGVRKKTNYDNSQIQWTATKSFRDALLKDTTLYGTEGFECHMDDKPVNKTEYNKELVNLKYGPYFPGFCPKARDHAIESVEKRPCQTTKEICVNSTKNGLQACGMIEVPITCPPHTNDLEKVGTNYRVNQLKKRDQQSMNTGESMNSAEIRANQEVSTEFLRTLFKQISFAGTFYSFYIALGLFFPTPLRLFRPSFIVQTKRILFGAQKYTFIATFLIIWWAIQYTGEILKSTEVRMYVESILNDPCFLDFDFVKERMHFAHEVCANLTELGNNWNLTKNQIDPMREEIELFSSECNCDFPGENLFKLEPPVDVDMSGFEKTTWNVRGDTDPYLWAPKLDSNFIGNETICRDYLLLKEIILESSENELSFVQLWITSGLLATFIVKIAITNFGVALLKLADPFCICGGKYEIPPMPSDDSYEGIYGETTHLIANDRIRSDKAASLRALAIRESLIWGFIANASLISLLVAAVQNVVESNVKYTDQDYFIGGILLFITIFMVPLICVILATCMSGVVDETNHDENGIEGSSHHRKNGNITLVDSLGFPIKNIMNTEIESAPTSPESGMKCMSSRPSSGNLSASSDSCQGPLVQRSIKSNAILPSSFNTKSSATHGHGSEIDNQYFDVDIDRDLSTSAPLLPLDRRNNSVHEFSQMEPEDNGPPNYKGSEDINSDHSSTLSDGSKRQNDPTNGHSSSIESALEDSLYTGTLKRSSALVDAKSLISEESDGGRNADKSGNNLGLHAEIQDNASIPTSSQNSDEQDYR